MFPLATTLAATVGHALGPLESGARRVGGQRHVPLQIWRTEAFQSWLPALEGAGNELREARQEWIHRVGPCHEHMLFSILRAVVFVTAEDHLKSNEVVLSRPDVASVVAYRRNGPLEDTKIILVREFRTPGCADDGFVRELPSDSSFAGMANPRSVAVNELEEETGLGIGQERLQKHHVRQVAATLSTHRAHLYSVELTRPEAEKLRSDAVTHGEAADSERTYVEVVRLSDMMALSRVDWSTVGAIFEVLLEVPRVLEATVRLSTLPAML